MSSLSYSEMDSFVSIFSDATHSDCGSVFSDEPTSECIETDFELQEQMDISGSFVKKVNFNIKL